MGAPSIGNNLNSVSGKAIYIPTFDSDGKIYIVKWDGNDYWADQAYSVGEKIQNGPNSEIKVGENIKILATYKKQPVMITDGHHFATSFHPEIGNDTRVHSYIMEQINA
mgnify:CR=1 FL=1